MQRKGSAEFPVVESVREKFRRGGRETRGWGWVVGGGAGGWRVWVRRGAETLPCFIILHGAHDKGVRNTAVT